MEGKLPNYKSLYRRHKGQAVNEIFSSLHKDEKSWEQPFEELSLLAKPELWNFQKEKYKKHGQKFPILMGYLNYAFIRLQEQNKITVSNNTACFNTGLQTKDEKDIFAIFNKIKFAAERNMPEWNLISFVDSYSDKLKPFNKLPEVATFITDSSDLVFNLDFDIEINIAHIVDENNERLPDALKNSRTLAMAAIEGATKFIKEKVRRNYKIAIPHWYRGDIQLLLPLNITSDNEADLALVADKDKDRDIYRIKTALSMDMAYIDARLICCPDRDWLNP